MSKEKEQYRNKWFLGIGMRMKFGIEIQMGITQIHHFRYVAFIRSKIMVVFELLDVIAYWTVLLSAL